MCDEKTILGNNGRTLRVKTCQNCSFDIFQPDVPSIVFKFLEGDIIFHLPSLTCLYQPPCVGVGQYSYIFMCHDHTVILRPFWKDFSNKLFFAIPGEPHLRESTSWGAAPAHCTCPCCPALHSSSRCERMCGSRWPCGSSGAQ